MPIGAPSATAEELAATRLLAGLGSEARHRLAGQIVVMAYARGETVIDEGTRGRDVFLLLSGQLLANRFSATGHEIGYRRLAPGDHFGELAALDGGPRSINIVAVADARVAVLPAATFHALLDTEPALARQLLAGLAGRVRELSDRLFEAGAIDTRGRVAAQLIRLAVANDASGDGATLAPAPTHAELAALVGGQRETVTRALSQLADSGVIAKAGRALIIRDFDALMALSGGL